MARLKRVMTTAQFNRAITAILADRAEAIAKEQSRVDAYRTGDYRFTRVWVKQHYVPRHDVSGHWRLVAAPKKKPTARSPKLRVLRGGAT